MNISKPQRQIFPDVARVIAIISISLNHAVNRTYDNYAGQQAEFLSIPLISSVIKALFTVFSHIGVPLFLMITGVLVLNKRMETQDDIKGFYKHNVLSLLITTEIWYVIMYWCKVLLDPTCTILADTGLGGALWGMVKTMLFMDQTTYGSMWYMPMILCLYTTIPFVIIIKDKIKKPAPVLLLPVLLTFLYFMVLPAINSCIRLNGDPTLTAKVREPNLMSFYYLYVLAGYFIGKGGLARLKDRTVIILTLLTFGLACAYQFYAYSCPRNYLIDYDFPLLLICGGFLFEWIRRKAHKLERMRRPITYISRISLGIYFLHIIIMVSLTYAMGDWGWNQLWRLLLLEASSLIISVVVIALLSKIKLLRKYLFLIK